MVNEVEAETVRTLFRLYRDLGTVRRLKEEVDRRGIVTKRRRLNGKESGSWSFTRGNLYQLLSNQLYNGPVPHNGETYPGQHAAIVDDVLWTAAQDRLAQNAADRRLAKRGFAALWEALPRKVLQAHLPGVSAAMVRKAQAGDTANLVGIWGMSAKKPTVYKF